MCPSPLESMPSNLVEPALGEWESPGLLATGVEDILDVSTEAVDGVNGE
jgi:hypothetical protein